MDLLKGTGFHDCEAKSGIHRTGEQEKKPGTLGLLFTGIIYFSSGEPYLCS